MRLSGKVWQHPFVDVFKLCRVEQWPRSDAAKHGDVTAELDRSIGKLVLRIAGLVPAANFVTLPQSRSHSLGLTGRYLYCQVQFVPGKCFVFHIDVVTADRNTVRISIGSLFKAEAQRRHVSGIQLAYPQPSDKWTVLALDLPHAIAVATSSPYAEVKAIQLCASMSARNFFTSDCVYKLETLPREMTLSNAKPLDAFHFEWLTQPPPEEQPTPVPKAAASPRSPGRTEHGQPVHLVASSLFPTTAPVPVVLTTEAATTMPSTLACQVAEPCGLQPDPALTLQRINGFTGEYTRVMFWVPNSPEVVFAAASTIIIMNVDTGAQRYLFGHTNSVCSLAGNAAGTLLASAEEGRAALVRLWDLASGRCLAILNGHASGMICIDVAPDGRSLLGVGLDAHAKQQLVLWDISSVPAGQKARVVTRHVTDYNIKCARFTPYEPDRLVACGKNSIRMYRLKAGMLRGMSITLGPAEVRLAAAEGPDLGANVFTDMAYETGYGLLQLEQRHVYVSSVSGAVYQINYGRRVLERIYQLHTGPINTLVINEGFCITASDDKFLRIWPVDFSDFLLEAEHEAPVTAIGVAPDGLRVAIGTENGSIGVLDVPTHQYATLLRSHTDAVNGVAKDPNRDEFCTVSSDGTIRVWDQTSHQQIYEFDAPGEVVLCCAYHPHRSHIACGFDTGRLRIFDVAATALVQEHRQHRGCVTQVLFSANGDFMFTTGAEGNLCVYEVAQDYLPIKYVQTSTPDRPGRLAVSADSGIVAATAYEAGQTNAAILLFTCGDLEPLQRIDSACEGITALAFAPDGRGLWALSSDRRLLQFSLPEGKLARTLADVHHIGADALAIEPSQRFIATGGQDRLVKLWAYPAEGSSAMPSQSFVGHSEGVVNLCFTHTHLLSVGPGDSTLIWQLPPAPERLRLAPGSIATSPDPSVHHRVEEWHALAEGAAASPSLSPARSARLSTATSWDVFLGPHERATSESWSPDVTPALGTLGTVERSALPASAQLHGTISFNGASFGTAVWCPATGMLAYAADERVVIQALQSREQREFLHHKCPVCCLATSTVGDVLASAAPACGLDGQAGSPAGEADDGQLCLWDVESGTCTHVMRQHRSGVQALSFSADGVWLVSVGKAPDRAVALWDVASGTAVAMGHVQIAQAAVAWRLDSALPEFITVGQAGAMLWALEPSHLAQHQLVLPPDLAAAGLAAVGCLAGDALAVGANDGSIWQMMVTSHGAVSDCHKLCAFQDAGEGAAITHLQTGDGRMCAGTASGILSMFKLTDGSWSAQRTITLDDSPASVTSLSLDPSLQHAVAATSAATIWDVNLEDGSKVARVTAHAAEVHSLCTSPTDPTLLASTSADGLLRIFSVPEDNPSKAFALYEYASPQPCTAAHFLADATHCLSGYRDGTLRLFDLQSGSPRRARGSDRAVWTVDRHQTPVVALASAPDGSRLLSASRDGVLAVTDTMSGTLVVRSAQLAHQAWPLDGLALAPSGHALAAAAWGDRLAVFATPWAESKCRTVSSFRCPQAVGMAPEDAVGPGLVAFGPTGSRTVLYTSPLLEGQVIVFDYRASAILRSLQLDSPVTALAAGPNNAVVATATASGRVALVHVTSGQMLDLPGNLQFVRAVSMASNRMVAASGKSVTVWELETSS